MKTNTIYNIAFNAVKEEADQTKKFRLDINNIRDVMYKAMHLCLTSQMSWKHELNNVNTRVNRIVCDYYSTPGYYSNRGYTLKTEVLSYIDSLTEDRS